MEAGRLRYKAEVQGRPDVPDGRGGFKKGDWTKLAVVPVAMTGLTQKDRLASGVNIPEDVVKITCRFCQYIRQQRRLVILGETYEVQSTDTDSRRLVLNVIARRVPSNG